MMRAINVICWLRNKMGAFLFRSGWRLMTPGVRHRISQMCAIGMSWAEHDFPDHFEITLTDEQSEKP